MIVFVRLLGANLILANEKCEREQRLNSCINPKFRIWDILRANFRTSGFVRASLPASQGNDCDMLENPSDRCKTNIKIRSHLFPVSIR